MLWVPVEYRSRYPPCLARYPIWNAQLASDRSTAARAKTVIFMLIRVQARLASCPFPGFFA